MVAIGALGVGVALLAALTVYASMSDLAATLVVAIVFGFPAVLVIAVGRTLERAGDDRATAPDKSLTGRWSFTAIPQPASSRPTFETFLDLIASISDTDARELAELERVPDWRRDRDPVLLLEPFLKTPPERTVTGRRVARDQLAIERAEVLLGREALDEARRRARLALDARSPSWPRMRRHRGLRAAAAVGVGMAALAWVLSLVGVLAPPADLALAVLGSVLAAGALLWSYVLPPSASDLRTAIDHAAVAHAAPDRLEDEHYAELADGFYAVLEGRWRRGRRPYGAWTWLFLGIVVVVLLGAIVVVGGAR